MKILNNYWGRISYRLKVAILSIIPILIFLIMFFWKPVVENLFTVLSLYFVYIGTLLVYYQIKINLNFNKRKAATDFIFDEINNILLPELNELRNILGKEYLLFEPSEDLLKELDKKKYDGEPKEKIMNHVKNILNFYERMSISIYKNTFDEDICYDDIGLLMISFFDWTASHIKSVQENYEERAYFNAVSLASDWSKRYEEHSEKIRQNQKRAKEMRQKIATIANKEIA